MNLETQSGSVWIAGLTLAVLPVALAAAPRALRAAAPPSRQQIEFFEGKIRPIFAEKCYSCHSATAEKIKGGLVLDTSEGLKKGGDSGAIVVPGELERSRLIQAVRYTDADLRMPPKEPLAAEQIADLEAWVKMGAPDPRSGGTSGVGKSSADHWAFKPAVETPLPKPRNRTWAKDPIDQWVLAGLEKRQLAPNPPAERSALLRRVSFDLIGLPPSPQEVEAFVQDRSTNAFEKVVDRLLQSQHFGERWGRHWLDVARYADSNGLEVNIPYPNAWRYRDYVIRSFNADKPFDRFIVEQLAGDLLPHRSVEEQHELWTATGLLVLGPKALGEPNRNKVLLDVVDDQIDVTTRAFLGLTVSCARCHDHKFDPISARDYYAMAGVFRSTQTLVDPAMNRPPQLGTPPWVERPLGSPEAAAAFETHQKRVGEVQAALQMQKQRRQELPGNLSSTNLTGVIVDNTQALQTGVWRSSVGATNFINKDYLHDAQTGKGTKSLRFTANLPAKGRYQVRFAFPHSFNRSTNTPVTIAGAGTPLTLRIDQTQSPSDGSVFYPLGTFEFEAGTNASVTVGTEGTSGFVVADAVQFLPERADASMRMAPAVAAKSGDSELAPPAMTMDSAAAQLSFDTLQREFVRLRTNAPPTPPSTMAVREGVATNSPIHLRGDPDKVGDAIPRGPLSVLVNHCPSESMDRGDASGRLELARWIANPKNPLTARVAVNRLWLHLFGRGLVETPDNFGHLGEPPSHPELLDHLALRFIQQGWSMKQMLRTMVLSRAYQMSSADNSTAAALDPDNRTLWRMQRKRLDAESLRDAMLAVSGRLDLALGGDPDPRPAPMAANPLAMRPPQGARDSLRRSVYLAVVRNDLPDVFQTFDFVDPHVINGRRHTTTSAPQALYLMNSPFVLEQSKQFAQSIVAQSAGNVEQGVAQALYRAFGRPPRPEEVQPGVRYLKEFERALNDSAQTKANGAPGKSWQIFCQALFASSRFRFIE